MTKLAKIGAIRGLNPGPLVPKTRIIPLDQSPMTPAECLRSFYTQFDDIGCRRREVLEATQVYKNQ